MTRDYNEIADRNEILRCTVGSRVLGINSEDADIDEMGVFVEPPEHVLGVSKPIDVVTYRTQPEGMPSGAGDVDRVRHSLRKYMRLATKGNPNFLLLLFCEPKYIEIESLLGYELRDLAPSILSKNCVWQTVGYLRGQLHRLDAGRGKRFPKRTALVQKYGWDVKYGGHAVRLALQAHELAVEGRLELPFPQWKREYILSIQQGEETKENTIAEAHWWEQKAIAFLENPRCALRDEPDWDIINDWMIRAHRSHWRQEIEHNPCPKVSYLRGGAVPHDDRATN